ELNELLEALYGHSVVMSHYRYVDAFMDFVGIHPLTASLTALQAVAEDMGLTGFDFNNADDSEENRRQSWLDLLFSP
ncbi:hypothetical protein SB861_69990, partial [Paraburkholderia sp. SIMBA_049]